MCGCSWSASAAEQESQKPYMYVAANLSHASDIDVILCVILFDANAVVLREE